MKQREKRNIIIGILCCMVVFMSVGYAVLSQNLKITGTANITGSWDIYIDSITFNESESSSTTSGTGSVDQADKTKATYNAELLKPQDVVVYDVVVANGGTIDAVLNDLVLDPTDTEYFTFETIGIEKGDELPAQTGDNPTTRSFKIKITFKDSVTEANMPDAGTQVNGLVKLDYVQKTTGDFGTSGLPGEDIVIPAEESPFKVTKDGTLIYYQRQGNETSVKVPAEVNGVKIKRIAGLAFVDNANVFVDNENGIAVGLDSALDEIGPTLAGASGAEYMSWEDYANQTMPTLDITEEYPKAFTHMAVDTTMQSAPYYPAENVNNYYLTEIDLSDAIYLETIGNSAFAAYDDNDEGVRLQNVVFPTNGVLTTIEQVAFSHTNLTGELVIPDSVTIIGKAAFKATKISSLVLPANLTNIEQEAFYDCANLTGDITIPSTIQKIGMSAFWGTNLSKITIKKATSDGIDLGYLWNNSSAEVIYDQN